MMQVAPATTTNKQSKTPSRQTKRKANEIVAAPQGDDDDNEEEEKEKAEEKEEAKAEASGSSNKKSRSDAGKERNKINKLQFAKGVRRVKVNSKWMILDPKVLPL